MKSARITSARSPMRRCCVAYLLALVSLTLFGCYYAEMRDDEAVEAYNQEFPQMPKKTIPVDGGIWIERETNPMELMNPLPDDSGIVARGGKGIGSTVSSVTVLSWMETVRLDKVSHPFPQT